MKNHNTMKITNKLALPAIAVLLIGANHAVAQGDRDSKKLLTPRMQSQQPAAYIGNPESDFDLVREVRNKDGTPHSKGDWSKMASYAVLYRKETDRDTIREMRYLSGTPKMKSQQQFLIAPLK
jgi:hypothetical protein